MDLMEKPTMFVQPFCLKVFEVGFGEKLFSKSFSPLISRKKRSVEFVGQIPPISYNFS
jgi:hypothetical protein